MYQSRPAYRSPKIAKTRNGCRNQPSVNQVISPAGSAGEITQVDGDTLPLRKRSFAARGSDSRHLYVFPKCAGGEIYGTLASGIKPKRYIAKKIREKQADNKIIQSAKARGTQGGPRENPGETQREPRENPERNPEGSQREPRGNPEGTQRDPRGIPEGTQREPRGNPEGTQREPGEPRRNPGESQREPRGNPEATRV